MAPKTIIYFVNLILKQAKKSYMGAKLIITQNQSSYPTFEQLKEVPLHSEDAALFYAGIAVPSILLLYLVLKIGRCDSWAELHRADLRSPDKNQGVLHSGNSFEITWNSTNVQQAFNSWVIDRPFFKPVLTSLSGVYTQNNSRFESVFRQIYFEDIVNVKFIY